MIEEVLESTATVPEDAGCLFVTSWQLPWQKTDSEEKVYSCLITPSFHKELSQKCTPTSLRKGMSSRCCWTQSVGPFCGVSPSTMPGAKLEENLA
jgi:hypothetical protein